MRCQYLEWSQAISCTAASFLVCRRNSSKYKKLGAPLDSFSRSHRQQKWLNTQGIRRPRTLPPPASCTQSLQRGREDVKVTVGPDCQAREAACTWSWFGRSWQDRSGGLQQPHRCDYTRRWSSGRPHLWASKRQCMFFKCSRTVQQCSETVPKPSLTVL